MNLLFLNRSLQLVPRTVPYLILVFDPELYVRLNEELLFFIYIDVHVDALSCVLRLCQRLKSLVNEDFQRNFKVCPQFCCFSDNYVVFKLLLCD